MSHLESHKPADRRELIDSRERTVVDFLVHRKSFDERFPKVDDILDRLSTDAQIVARAAVGSK